MIYTYLAVPPYSSKVLQPPVSGSNVTFMTLFYDLNEFLKLAAAFLAIIDAAEVFKNVLVPLNNAF